MGYEDTLDNDPIPEGQDQSGEAFPPAPDWLVGVEDFGETSAIVTIKQDDDAEVRYLVSRRSFFDDFTPEGGIESFGEPLDFVVGVGSPHRILGSEAAEQLLDQLQPAGHAQVKGPKPLPANDRARRSTETHAAGAPPTSDGSWMVEAARERRANDLEGK